LGYRADSLDNIFDEFRQIDGTTTRRFEGTGLGLTIAKRSALLLGGDIIVESKENEGSTFTIVLPIELPDVDVNVVERNILSPLPIAKKDEYRLLIVEDQESIRIQLATLLKQKGIKFDIAIGGREAIEYCNKSRPDGIILDLMMPGIDGFQVLESIRSKPETKTIPVLILTAKELTKSDLNRLSTNNIQQLVQKGDIDLEKFITKINLLLNLEGDLVEKTNEKPIISKPKKIKKPTTTKGGTQKILIVEDNPDNMISLKAVLPVEYTTLEATDGMMGLKMIKKHKPDLVLLDIMLPKLDGMSVIKKVLEDDSLKEISIIAITANAMKGDKEKLLKAGFDDYISKPINVEELIKKIEKLLNT
jgi:CheY-like chemotaxis protein